MIKETSLTTKLREKFIMVSIMPHINGYAMTGMLTIVRSECVTILSPKVTHAYLKHRGVTAPMMSYRMALTHDLETEYVLLMHHELTAVTRTGHVLWRRKR